MSEPRKHRRGRRANSAGKQLGPERTLEENLDIAALGEFALDPKIKEIFCLVGLWQQWHAPLFQEPQASVSPAEAALRVKRKANVTRQLLGIVVPALGGLDARPFLRFAKAIKAVRNWSGPVSPAAFEVLRAIEEVAVEKRVESEKKRFHRGLAWVERRHDPTLTPDGLGFTGKVTRMMKRAEYRKRLRRPIDRRTQGKIERKFDLPFALDKGGRPRVSRPKKTLGTSH